MPTPERVKEAVERLELTAYELEEGMPRGCVALSTEADLRTILAALDESEKARALLAAEVWAWRACDERYDEWMRREGLVYDSRADMFDYRMAACSLHSGAMEDARAIRRATDAAGALPDQEGK